MTLTKELGFGYEQFGFELSTREAESFKTDMDYFNLDLEIIKHAGVVILKP